MADTTTCRSGGATIWFAPTGKGRRIPLDAEPHPQGNVVILDGVATVLPPGTRAEGREHYRSHFVTCAHAAKHRKTKGGA